MKYETIKFNVGNEQYDVIHCLGDGQCECDSCKEKGKWSLSWTSWFYKLNETDKNVLCRDCLAEILIQRRIDKAVKDKIEQGTLIELDDKLIDEGVYGIQQDTTGKYWFDDDEHTLLGFTSDGIVTWNDNHRYNDWFKNGLWFFTREEAEKCLKELGNEKNT